MKLKEVCESTGLTRKTIRLYEEKGLLVPHKEYRNGREYREYTPGGHRTAAGDCHPAPGMHADCP